MKKLYIIIFNLLIGNCLYSQYCVISTGSAFEDDIFNVTIVGTTLNNSSTCASTGIPANSIINRYSDYTNITTFLVPGVPYTINVTVGNCNSTDASNYGMAVFIDYNRNNVFDLPAERVCTHSNQTFGTLLTGTFTVPSTASLGNTTRMRVIQGEEGAWVSSTSNGCANPTWGETEDYTVFLGNKKWDYQVLSMVGPDSISFCAQNPTPVSVSFKNVENQPLNGGRVDLYIRDTSAGGTTNLFFSKAFTQTILQGNVDSVTFNPIVFPKDELLEFKFVMNFPLDSNRSNDTLIRYVQVYKNPTFTLKADTVCLGQKTTVSISNQSKPVFVKWDNESILDTTTYNLAGTRMIGIQVSRGWKCNVTGSVLGVVKPLPQITVSNDTILCKGQSAVLTANMNMNGYFKWDYNSTISPSISVDTSGVYVVTAFGSNNCNSSDSVRVGLVFPPSYTKLIDTVCAGSMATTGLNNSTTGFIYKWQGRTETTPIIQPTPTVDGQPYYVQWWYQGCTSYDTVKVKVNPLPNVTLSNPAPICPFFSATLSASGGNSYLWRNGLGTNNTITVSPLTSTIYSVLGTDTNQCSKEVSYKLVVYPRPDMAVYSNKYKENICLGDSATVYVNGGKTYIWAHGPTDSVLKLVPTQSFQWNVIGTDNNGCKDTVTYRMTVKPAFKPSFIDTVRGCEGDSRRVHVSGGKAYDWGNGAIDSFLDITLANTTKYQVTVTSPEDCQVVAEIPTVVMKKPIPQVSDLTICSKESGKLEAKGGTSYSWSTGGNSNIETVGSGALASFDVSVTVTNEAGCSDVASTTVKVINTDSFPVVFKSPLDSYMCPSPKIPITMTATPTGGVWSGTNVTGNKLSPDGLSGVVQILYTILDPINGCKVERTKNVKFVTKCSNSINGIDGDDVWSVYPNPFSSTLKLRIEQSRSEMSTINLYDISGRIVMSRDQKLNIGENLIELNNLQLPKGVYYIELQTESVSRQAKIIAQ